jgi:hypothetical protein
LKLFSCPTCGQTLYFENSRCLGCGGAVLYDPETELFVPAGGEFFECANAQDALCNWRARGEGQFCRACELNRTIPDLSIAGNRGRWVRVEAAKRRLVYALLSFGLPVGPKQSPGDEAGIAFDFLAPGPGGGPGGEHILTGHESGLITLNVAEADSVERERMRIAMGESYRTLLGHFRHEIGHYYWDRLIRDDADWHQRFRSTFGDEGVDYEQALRDYYSHTTHPGWMDSHISAYAASHPWEDWAETWAHYLHIVDTLEMADALGALSEADVDLALREVRRALLEADVALDVVRSFTDKVKAKAVGANVVKSVTPGQMVVKIVHDELVEMLGGADAQPIDLVATPPVPIMLVGLQGSGKTTTCAKIAKRLTDRDRKKVLMASLDTRRPAAQEQLRVLGEQTGVATLPIIAGQTPKQIAARAIEAGKLGGYDVVLLDTAGRIHIDEELMQESADVRDIARPHETLLVADSLTGQDAVNLAKSFNERVGITGIVLTRVDGDGRGGAALSMRAVTGKPIKLIGVGERWDALEDFHPQRIAGRILGMGDVVSSSRRRRRPSTPKRPRPLRRRCARASSISRISPSSCADAEARRHGRAHGHDARHGQDQAANAAAGAMDDKMIGDRSPSSPR